MTSMGVMTVLMMAKMEATIPNMMAMATQRTVNNHNPNGMRFGLRSSSSLTVHVQIEKNLKLKLEK